MKGIATMLFGIAMILLAICSALLFFMGGYTVFAVLLGISAFVGFFAVLCGLAQVYERPKEKKDETTETTDTQDQTENENN